MRRRILSFLVAFALAVLLCLYLQLLPLSEGSSQPQAHQSVLGGLGQDMSNPEAYVLPFRTAGRHIVDAHGRRFKIASVNWYGASDIHYVAMGLDVRHRRDIARTIRELGFNSVRFPYSDEMVIKNPLVDVKHISANLDLLDNYSLDQGNQSDINGEARTPRALDIYAACIEAMTEAGLAVIPNNHITNAAWCDGKNLCDSSWKNDQYGPICKIHQTTDSWIEHWLTVMQPHVDNPLVIGADLRNEPRGIWGTMTWNMWATAAEQASEALLKMQSNWLMFVEGVSSANDCSGARRRPIELSIPDRVVYSSHVYSWSGWGSFKPYSRRDYTSFAKDMDRNWGYLLSSNIAPVWVGEFGASHNSDEGAHHYWDNLMKYLQLTDADFGYWALNPRKPERYDNETYGLLKLNWETPVEDFRLEDLRRLMAQDSANDIRTTSNILE